MYTHTSDCVALGWFGDVGFIGPLGFEVAWFMFSERSFFIFGFQIYGEPGQGSWFLLFPKGPCAQIVYTCPESTCIGTTLRPKYSRSPTVGNPVASILKSNG